jgi:hypothetical protein
MEVTGRINSLSRDWKSGKMIISFLVDSVPSDIEDLQRRDVLDITAKPHRQKRSLNANAYFHVLTGKIAEAVGASLTHVKNQMIREYGQYEVIDGMIPTMIVKAKYEDGMLDMDGIHLRVVERGPDTVRLALMRGSHTYNTAEMSRLIDAVVEEAKQLGIETATPDQLERMKATWTRKD